MAFSLVAVIVWLYIYAQALLWPLLLFRGLHICIHWAVGPVPLHFILIPAWHRDKATAHIFTRGFLDGGTFSPNISLLHFIVVG